MISQVGSKTHSHRAGGCGCGGKGQGCGCGCGCECAPEQALCDPCSEEGLSRPLFFAGQLLTEEDLQSVVDYVVARHRLTNRHLFGDGVVCGLQIHIDPCKPRRVIVDPGHALDCCGNDILVSCPVTLDILKMVHELRVKLRGGFDCGDPCEDTSDEKRQQHDDQVDDEHKKPPDSAQTNDLHLDLLIRYCERRTEPVAPYDIGDSCDPSACEPTRIQEGFSFELRCHEDRQRRDTMRTRQMACGPPDDEIRKRAAHEIATAQVFADTVDRVLLEAQRLKQEGFSPDDIADFEKARSSLQEFAKERVSISDKNLHDAFDAIRRVVGGVRRLELAHNRDEVFKKSGFTKPDELLHTARIVWDKIKGFAAAAPKKALVDERMIAVMDEELNPERKPAPEAPTFTDYAMAAGVLFAHEDVDRVILNLSSLKRRIADAIERHDFITDAGFERELATIKLDAFKSMEMTSNRHMMALAAAARRLVRLAHTTFNECDCKAVLPPCPPCDDRAVLIACLEVSLEECMVKRVCNLCRLYVPSAPALRYWGLDRLNGFLAQWRPRCCPPPCPTEESKRKDDAAAEQDHTGATLMAMLTPMRVEDPAPMLLGGRIGGIEVRKFASREPIVIEVQSHEGEWRRQQISPEVFRLLVSTPSSRSSLAHAFLPRIDMETNERGATLLRWRVVASKPKKPVAAGRRPSVRRPSADT